MDRTQGSSRAGGPDVASRSSAPRTRGVSSSLWQAWWPRAVLLWLLLLCAFHGVRTVAGLAVPPDEDLLRDIGYAQGILDGNWFGDPVYAGEWRYYPPLIAAIGATLFVLARGTDLLRFWLEMGPWLNLLVPLAFFFAAGALLACAPAAAVATAVFVVFNGLISAPWDAGGYTPWAFSPSIAQALFFLAAWLISTRAARARWTDALLIGLAIGVTFLAHSVPGLILTAMVAAAAFVAQGLRMRTVGWLAVTAAAQLPVMMVYFAPLLLHYPDGMVHLPPALYSDWLMQRPLHPWLLVMNAPGIVALVATLLLWRRAPLGHVTVAMLAAWIGVCALFLLRHFACPDEQAGSPGAAPAVCRAFVVTIHHFHLYLQIAWALLMGHVAWHVARLWVAGPAGAPVRRGRAAVAIGLALVMLATGSYAVLRRGFDRQRREMALAADYIDRDTYGWILANTPPGARFVTEHAAESGPTAFAVMAAGRNLVASPESFSNPFVRWEPREAERLALIAAAVGEGPARALCDAAGPLWLVFEADKAVAPGRLKAVHRTEVNTIFRVSPALCTQ